MDNDTKRRELLQKWLEYWKSTGQSPPFILEAEISTGQISRYFESDGEAKVIFHDDGTISVGIARFHPLTYKTQVELETFGGDGELPSGARQAILNKLKQYEKDFLASLPGRPRGSGHFEDDQQFRNEIGKIVKGLSEQGEKVTQGVVAKIYNCDPRQLREWCKNFTGLKWRDFVNEILDS